MHLQLHGFSVFIDVEKLEAGKFEDKLIQSIMSARNFVLVLSAGALDKCMQDHDCKDWVHKVSAGLGDPRAGLGDPRAGPLPRAPLPLSVFQFVLYFIFMCFCYLWCVFFFFWCFFLIGG